jgi:hypothetical protein
MIAGLKKIHIMMVNGVMKMDRRKCDRDIICKMHDIIELIYILNRLANDEEGHSKQCLLDMVDSMQNPKHCYDKHSYKCNKRREIKHDCRYDCPYYKAEDSFIDKIIFYLKSLNEG